MRLLAFRLDPTKQATLDTKLVEQLQSDLRRMTKIYQAIPADSSEQAVKQFVEAQGLFKAFHDNVETLVYQQLLTGDSDKENWAEKALREKAWSFLINVSPSRLLPKKWDYKTDTYVAAPWALEHDRQTNVRRYQRDARAFFTALTEYIDYKQRVGESLDVRPEVEVTDIAGIHVIIHNKQRTEHGDKTMREALDSLDVAIDKMKRAGFKRAYEGLTLHIGFGIPKGLVAGLYNPAEDELWVYALGLSKDNGTFIHECGHRFYFKRLGSNAKAEWERIIGERMVKVTPEAVDIWMDAYESRPEVQRGFSLLTKDRLALASSLDLSESMAAQVRFLADFMPGFTRENDEIRAWLKKEHVGTQVALEHISDYGATNAWEAFAEAFKLYVLKGPGAIGDWTRQFFKDIVRSGGASVRSSVVRASVVRALRAAASALLEAKGSGFPKMFKEAVDAYVAGGPEDDMIAALRSFMALFMTVEHEGMFGNRVVQPTAPWFLALSDIKRKKIERAFDEAKSRIFLLEHEKTKAVKDPANYERYRLGNRQAAEPFLRAIEKVAKAVDALMAAESSGGFKHGPFTIKILPGVTKKQVDEALAALDVVTDAIKQKFPQVLYGEIYMSTKVGGHRTAAHYVPADDVIHLSPKHIQSGDAFDVHAIAHEFGHRYDHKFADGGLRRSFDDPALPAVTKYGQTSPTENFAEAFAFYVLGKPLPDQLHDILNQMR